jgi:hypothetical protein
MSRLREKMMTLSDAQLAMLVVVAFEAINDLPARKEIAEMRDWEEVELESFGEEVVEPLLDYAGDVLGLNTPSLALLGDRETNG